MHANSCKNDDATAKAHARKRVKSAKTKGNEGKGKLLGKSDGQNAGREGVSETVTFPYAAISSVLHTSYRCIYK